MQFVTVAGAGDNDNGVISPPKVVSTGGPDVVISFPAAVDVSPTTAVPGEALDVTGFTVLNQGARCDQRTRTGGMYLSTDSVITAADILMETFTTPTPLQPGGSVFFPLIEGDTNSVDVPAGVAPGHVLRGISGRRCGTAVRDQRGEQAMSARSCRG